MTARSLQFRLCVMMFIEYAIQGIWYPYLASYLSSPHSQGGLAFTEGQKGWVLGFANAVGAVAAPFIAGQVADRYLNAERALAILHLVAAVFLFINSSSTSFPLFFALMICFSIAYVPTRSLANSLTLTHLPDRERQYPRARLFGTLGWIVSSSLFTFLVLNAKDPATNIARIPWSLKTAAILAIFYAGYAFFCLPKTPPHPSSDSHPLEAFSMLRIPSVLVLSFTSILIACIHVAYYLDISPFLSAVVHVPAKLLGPTIAVSQTSEVLFLFALGPLLARFGYKKVLLLGAGAQALRFFIFAINPSAPIVIVSLTLHGVAFACFQTTAILYIQRLAPPHLRHSTQTVFGIVLFGIGPALAGPYSQLFNRFVRAGHPDFHKIWLTQFAVAAVCVVVVTFFFREEDRLPAKLASPA